MSKEKTIMNKETIAQLTQEVFGDERIFKYEVREHDVYVTFVAYDGHGMLGWHEGDDPGNTVENKRFELNGLRELITENVLLGRHPLREGFPTPWP